MKSSADAREKPRPAAAPTASSSAQLGNAHLRAADEARNLAQIGIVRRRIRHGPGGVQQRCRRLEQLTHRVLDAAYALCIEALTLEPDRIDYADHRRIAFRDHERQDVLGHLVGGSDERVFSQPHELDHARHAIDRCVVVDLHVPGQFRAASQNDMAADAAIVAHVAVGQERAVVGDAGRRTVVGRRVHRAIFPKDVAVADLDMRHRTAPELHVFRAPSDAGERKEFIARPNAGRADYRYMRMEYVAIAQLRIHADVAIRPDDAVRTDDRAVLDNGR